jgi:hypothetical protein
MRSKRFESIIDSGASRCIFHADIGRSIGLEIEKGTVEETLGVSGIPNKTYLHKVVLYVPGGPLEVLASFSDDLPVAGLLGIKGFFENYRIVFDPILRQCELERIHRT